MKANEAKLLAVKSVNNEIKDIESSIKQECEKGNLSLTVLNLKPATIEYFEKEGFELKSHSIGNAVYTKIFWSN